MNNNQDVAAHNLLNMTLKDIWLVKEKIEKSGSQTASINTFIDNLKKSSIF